MTTLHYIYDPLCGWCYAAGPMVAAASRAGIPLSLHGGGLWDTPTRIAPEKRAYIRQADARIAALAGVPFGPSYLEGLLSNPDVFLWSRPVTAAVLAAATLEPDAALAMLAAIQKAHYVEGGRVSEPAVLVELAAEIGLPAGFADALDIAPVDDHFVDTRRLMRRFGSAGFPGFLLERDGLFTRITHERFYGRPHDFAAALASA